MTTTEVTLPPSLVFLVSNFHSFVTLKLDGTNYLLWRIQIENVMRANGYFEFLDGSSLCPPAQITNSDGTSVSNPKCVLWKLIDTQLLMCLTASLSQTTLPYILGLHSTHQVWDSLSNRYNSLSKSHVQDLKGKLYSITKTSTIEHYVDTLKEFSQKLIAAGSPVDEDDLIFHTLRGLPPVFNGFKTTVRAMRIKGDIISFDQVVNMLNGEDQLLQESSAEHASSSSSVLVATHGSPSPQGPISTSTSSMPASLNTSSVSSGIPQSVGQYASPPLGSTGYYGSAPPSVQSVLGPHPSHPYGESSPSQYVPSQFLPSSFRGFPRGRGRGPRPPCDICGRSNHTTNYCYYKSSFSQNFQSIPPFVQGAPWRSSNQFQSWSNTPPWFNTGVPVYQSQMHAGVPMYQPHHMPTSRPSFSTQQPVYSSQPSQAPFTGYSPPPTQAHFAGFTDSFPAAPMTSVSGMMLGGASSNVPSFTGFTGGYSGTSSSVTNPSTHPWYFDSGATNHITNNLQNLAISQPATAHDGIMVGNGSQLQASHTGKGQDYTPNLVQGTMSHGSVSHSDLL